MNTPTDYVRAERFFYEHAGWSYDPTTEISEQGRERCARELAAAEEWAQRAGITFKWEDDWEYRVDHDAGATFSAIAYMGRDVVASLGGIEDPGIENVRVMARVIEAELASEAYALLIDDLGRI